MIKKKSHNKYPITNSFLRHTLRFGNSGFKSLSSSRLTENQLNCLKKLIKKKLDELTISNKFYKVWCLASVNKTLTKLSLESRMGKGKGDIVDQFVFIKSGTILFEFLNVNELQLQLLTNFIIKKSSLKITLIKKEGETQ